MAQRTVRKNKGINFTDDEHLTIASLRLKLIAKKGDNFTMAETVMEGIKLLQKEVGV